MCSNILHMTETVTFLGGLPLMRLVIYIVNDRGWDFFLIFQSLTFFFCIFSIFNIIILFWYYLLIELEVCFGISWLSTSQGSCWPLPGFVPCFVFRFLYVWWFLHGRDVPLFMRYTCCMLCL